MATETRAEENHIATLSLGAPFLLEMNIIYNESGRSTQEEDACTFLNGTRSGDDLYLFCRIRCKLTAELIEVS